MLHLYPFLHLLYHKPFLQDICVSLFQSEYILLLDTLEEEKNNLLAYDRSLKERLQQEREKNETQQEIANKQKIRISRLEGKIRKSL